MARYATQEELFECPECIVRFALRECEVIGTNPDKPLYLCPSCEDYFVAPGPQQFATWGRKSLTSAEWRNRPGRYSGEFRQRPW